MAYTTINKSTDYFNTLLWTGNSGNQSITGNDFTADFTWSKTRSNAESHILMDTVRDAGTTLNQSISSNTNNAEGTLNNSSTLTVNSTGFDLAGTSGGTLNYTGYTYATWLWRAGGHTGSSNTDGSINTTATSVNTTSGFSISTYTGTGSAGTIGHGLGVAPAMIIAKRLNAPAESWIVYHQSLDASAPQDKYLHLNTTDAVGDSAGMWNDTAPTSSVFSVGTSTSVNQGGGTFVAYCFAEKKGFSKFGSYTGNGNADGSFIYTGFKPAFVMIKRINTSENWFMFDNKRSPFNLISKYLVADGTGTDSNADFCDFVSNGYKIKVSNASFNESGSTYIYLAFAESPIVSSNGVPATAR